MIIFVLSYLRLILEGKTIATSKVDKVFWEQLIIKSVPSSAQ